MGADEVEELRSQETPQIICSMEKKILPCRAYMLRWYFDAEAGDCKVFTYGGCLPNGNNFRTYGEYSSYCSEFVNAGSISRESKSSQDFGSSSMIYTTKSRYQ